MRSHGGERSPSVADRVFVVLQSCGATDRSLTLADLVELTGLPKTTLHRVCWKLVELGMLERSGSGFRTGTKLFELGGMNPRLRALRATAMPYMHTLASRTAAAVNLAVQCDSRALIVDEVFAGRTSHVTRMVGSPMPLHATAIGKALLSGVSPAELDRLLGEGLLRPYTRWTVVRPNLLREQLERIRQTGAAFSHEEWKLGTAGVAAPVYSEGEVVAAIAVITTPDETLLGDAAHLLRTAAGRITEALDAPAPVPGQPNGIAA
jgi:IclR family transcriptional regulator, acetate operon repressor